jgi:hypothetical protein
MLKARYISKPIESFQTSNIMNQPAQNNGKPFSCANSGTLPPLLLLLAMREKLLYAFCLRRALVFQICTDDSAGYTSLNLCAAQ